MAGVNAMGLLQDDNDHLYEFEKLNLEIGDRREHLINLRKDARNYEARRAMARAIDYLAKVDTILDEAYQMEHKTCLARGKEAKNGL